MLSFARAYVYLLAGERRPASPAAVDPLDSLLTRLVVAPIEWLAALGRRKPATPPVRRLHAIDGGGARRATHRADRGSLRPAA